MSLSPSFSGDDIETTPVANTRAAERSDVVVVYTTDDNERVVTLQRGNVRHVPPGNTKSVVARATGRHSCLVSRRDPGVFSEYVAPGKKVILVESTLGYHVMLQKSNRLQCPQCGLDFDSAADGLVHYGVPDTKRPPLVIELLSTGGVKAMPKQARKTNEEGPAPKPSRFKRYLDESSQKKRACFHLLPQIRPASLRSRLEGEIKKRRKDSATRYMQSALHGGCATGAHNGPVLLSGVRGSEQHSSHN